MNGLEGENYKKTKWCNGCNEGSIKEREKTKKDIM